MIRRFTFIIIMYSIVSIMVILPLGPRIITKLFYIGDNEL